ncbi:MAG TPA: BON domain-containing protein [Longimicrobiales bacterium]
MRRERPARLSDQAWAIGLGAAAGVAGGWWLSRRQRRALPGAPIDLAGLEEQVVSAFLEDPLLSQRPIEVAALSDGIVELSGSVRTEHEADRAVHAAQRVPGVTTVLNRLDVELLRSRLAETRRRFDAGAPDLTETHWYGLRVGTGPRRQGQETEPDRPDEKVLLVSRALGVNRAEEQTSEALAKLSPGVEGHTTAPAAPTDRGRAEDAAHRRLGNVPPDPLQDLNPASGIHQEVKKGTELTLEESGLEAEERGAEGGP